MALKQELEEARAAMGAAMHNVNTVLTALGVEPAATVAALPPCITAAHAAGEATAHCAPYIDTSKMDSLHSFFAENRNAYFLNNLALLDTSNVMDFYGTFYANTTLTAFDGAAIDMRKAWRFTMMFQGATALKTVSNVMSGVCAVITDMFNGCTALEEVHGLDFTAVGYASRTFNGCTSLTTVDGIVGEINVALNLSSAPLSHNSLMNFVNALKNLSGGTAKTLTLGAANLAKLTADEQAVATQKGWVLQ